MVRIFPGEEPIDPSGIIDGEEPGADYTSAFQGRSNTVIEGIIVDSPEGLPFSKIDFDPYGNPSVSVSSSARFAKHEVIGGTTVRQKIGEDPREITVDGVCTEAVAQQINYLHRASRCTLNTEVLNNLVRCQVGSVSTNPLEDGGAADMDGGEMLYEFSISLVEFEAF